MLKGPHPWLFCKGQNREHTADMIHFAMTKADQRGLRDHPNTGTDAQGIKSGAC